MKDNIDDLTKSQTPAEQDKQTLEHVFDNLEETVSDFFTAIDNIKTFSK